MDYGILVLMALVVGGGVAGGLLSAWSCHRRVHALEEYTKIQHTANEDRFNQLSRIVTRQDKTEAAKARWSKKDVDENTLVKTLTDQSAGTLSQVVGHPWDPRTWGKG